MNINRTREAEAIFLYEEHDYTAAKEAFQELHNLVQDETERTKFKFNIASCLASQGQLDEAMELISELGISNNCLLFNKALCEYHCGNHDKALLLLSQLIENCSKDEFESISYIEEGRETRGLEKDRQAHGSNQSDRKLRDSCLIEAINLKAACLFKISSGDVREAAKVLASCPIKSQELVDCITLNNQALYETGLSDSDQSIDKFLYVYQLIEKETGQDASLRGFISPEIVDNLFTILVDMKQANLASDLLEATEDLRKQSSIEQTRYHRLQLECLELSADSLAYEKINLFLDHILSTIKSTNPTKGNLSSHRNWHQLVELAMSIVHDQCNLLWVNNKFNVMERLLHKVKFLYEPNHIDLWNKSMAHLVFMMDTRFEESAYLYEKFLPDEMDKNGASLHLVDPVVLSNLCVSYVLTGRNGEAEVLIKQLEEEKEQLGHQLQLSNVGLQEQIHPRAEPSSRDTAHLSVINLAIETLYCLKNNHDFGLTRMFKTFECHESGLNEQSWFLVKRCILSVLDSHCRHQIYIRDELLNQMVAFLMHCERSSVSAARLAQMVTPAPLSSNPNMTATTSTRTPTSPRGSRAQRNSEMIAYESRYLRSILVAIIHD